MPQNTFRVGELTETLDFINRKLEREFGRDLTGRPIWRVVWSDTQIEKRKMYTTDEGLDLLQPEVREVKKYQHISERYVLEKLTEVVGETDLITPMSYEPLWTFQDRFNQYLPPRFDACKFVIETVNINLAKGKGHVKYKDETTSPEYREALLKRKEQELFGNETPVGDALAHDFGVTVPRNYEKQNEDTGNG